MAAVEDNNYAFAPARRQAVLLVVAVWQAEVRRGFAHRDAIQIRRAIGGRQAGRQREGKRKKKSAQLHWIAECYFGETLFRKTLLRNTRLPTAAPTAAAGNKWLVTMCATSTMGQNN